MRMNLTNPKIATKASKVHCVSILQKPPKLNVNFEALHWRLVKFHTPNLPPQYPAVYSSTDTTNTQTNMHCLTRALARMNLTPKLPQKSKFTAQLC